jgi:putative molybdopterin biosynthesis protein
MSTKEGTVYLQMMPLSEARTSFVGAFDCVKLVGDKEVDVAAALGRLTAAPVFAGLSSPAHHTAAMDGIALISSSTYCASDAAPVRLEIGREAHFANLGHPSPAGTNAVVMIE